MSVTAHVFSVRHVDLGDPASDVIRCPATIFGRRCFMHAFHRTDLHTTRLSASVVLQWTDRDIEALALVDFPEGSVILVPEKHWRAEQSTGYLEEEGQAWNVARTAEEIAAERAEIQWYAEARKTIEAQVSAAFAIPAALLAAARFKEVEAQRDALADALEMILATDGSKGTFDASGLYAAHGTAVVALRAAGRLP